VCSVKAGGPDPVANSKLADLLKQAKDLGVPKDIIERNIKKASDAKQGDFQECIYEAYGPGGTGFIIEALTDNVNRTAGRRWHWQHASCSTSFTPVRCTAHSGGIRRGVVLML
jgi:transcriptional/translational regulatory protein YebC/TACO1